MVNCTTAQGNKSCVSDYTPNNLTELSKIFDKLYIKGQCII